MQTIPALKGQDRTCKLHTEKPQLAGGFEPRNISAASQHVVIR